MSEARAGDDDAFAELARRYQDPLLRYCTRLVGRERAQDAVQMALTHAFVALHRPDLRSIEARPWLYRIAHNAAIDVLRRAPPAWEQIDPQRDGVAQPPQVFERRERLRETLRAIQALPERQRRALLLRELEGRDYEEIATALGVGNGSVRQLLFRARATLRSAAALILIPPWMLRRMIGHVSGRLASSAAPGAGGGFAPVAGVAAKLGVAVVASGALAVGAGKLSAGPASHDTPAAQPPRVTLAQVLSGPAPLAHGPHAGHAGTNRPRSNPRATLQRITAPYIGGGRRTASGLPQRTAAPVTRLGRGGTPGRHSTPIELHRPTPEPVPAANIAPTSSTASPPPAGTSASSPDPPAPSAAPSTAPASTPPPASHPSGSGHIVSYQPNADGTSGTLVLVRAANNETVSARVTGATAITCHYYAAGVATGVVACPADNLRSGVQTTGFPTQRPIDGQGTWTQIDLIIER